MNTLMLNNYCLVEFDQTAETTKEGIVIATSEGDKTESIVYKGRVVSMPDEIVEGLQPVGSDDRQYRRIESKVKVGDIVMCPKWSIHWVTLNGVKYMAIPYKEIVGVVS
jgi:co-chaperonin GroES (HSP10)